MHPAYSVILFTSASGAGYGLLIWLAVSQLQWVEPLPRIPALLTAVLALVLVTGGLLSSTLHLGHPERAWRAFSQWRSSWLSREGVLAVASYPLALLLLAGIFFGKPGILAGVLPAILLIIFSLATVVSTGMIYASLQAIPRWNNGWVVPLYLLFAVSSGGLLFAWVSVLCGSQPPTAVVLLLVLGSWAAKLGYWRFIDTQNIASNSGTATGLGHLGGVRQLEAPHTSENYLMQEMGFEVARKHAVRLRWISVWSGLVLPLVLILVAGFLPGMCAALSWSLAVISGLTGILVERWLFFAEARHLVTLYYGRSV